MNFSHYEDVPTHLIHILIEQHGKEKELAH